MTRVASGGGPLVACADFPSRGFAIRPAIALLLCLPLLVLSGCGAHAGATFPTPTPARSARAHPAASAAAPTALPTVAQPSGATSSPTPTPALTATPHQTSRQATPTATPTPASVPTVTSAPAVSTAPVVVSASLRPLSPTPQSALSAAVITQGNVSQVQMYLGSGAPGTAGPETFPLSEGPTGTWTGGGTAPAVAGTYHYTVGIFTATGRHIVDNDSWNIQVTGAPTSAPSAAALPADIPLVPPFNYGNPVPATFTGEGHSVNGAEVVSNSRPDVPASSVASFYEAHLARAGWTVDQSSVPSAGAASFSIGATKSGSTGTRVCIVQYSGSAVHILYGTAG